MAEPALLPRASRWRSARPGAGARRHRLAVTDAPLPRTPRRRSRSIPCSSTGVRRPPGATARSAASSGISGGCAKTTARFTGLRLQADARGGERRALAQSRPGLRRPRRQPVEATDCQHARRSARSCMTPERFDDRGVTVAGRFRGRNLFGDLPNALNRRRWDFVLQSSRRGDLGHRTAAARAGLRARRRRADGHRTLPRGHGHRAREGEQGLDRRRIGRAWPTAPSDTDESRRADPGRQGSAAGGDLHRAARRRNRRRAIDDRSGSSSRATWTAGRSRDTCGSATCRAPSAAPRPAPIPPIDGDLQRRQPRVEIKFAQPLERFQNVKVELLEGITAMDGQPLAPWSLTFTSAPSSAGCPTPSGSRAVPLPSADSSPPPPDRPDDPASRTSTIITTPMTTTTPRRQRILQRQRREPTTKASSPGSGPSWRTAPGWRWPRRACRPW